MSALGSPTHLHQRGNRNGRVGYRETATNEHRSREGARTQDAHAAVAEIVNATIKFLGQGIRGLTGQQTAGMDFEDLRETLMPASLLI